MELLRSQLECAAAESLDRSLIVGGVEGGVVDTGEDPLGKLKVHRIKGVG
jgi:hypothetical protein